MSVGSQRRSNECRSKFWVRKVNVITLPELFDNYMGDVCWRELCHAWLEGACVIRARLEEGPRGKPARTNDPTLQRSVGSQRRSNECRQPAALPVVAADSLA